MHREEQISELIGEIYDATLDPSLWAAVLPKSARFVGGLSATLVSKDAASKTGYLHFIDDGVDPRYVQSYFDKYVKIDPSATTHVFAEIGEPISLVDVMPLEEFAETRFYKEWVRPQGLLDFLSASLDKTPTTAALFGVLFPESAGLVDLDMRRRMRLLAPHVRRAVLISRVIELKTLQADTFAEMLDGLAAAMFLVSVDGRIVHANAAGHTMLAEGRVVRAANGRLAPLDQEAARSLEAVFAAAGLDDSAVGTSGISVPLAAGEGEQLVAHALPLISGLRRDTGNTYKAAAALFVHKAPLDAPSPPEVIARTYRLTPTELRVLLAAVEVGGVAETADALGISDNTVKTHLKRLYAKTGANRQADLVKLVARFSSPLA